MRTLFARTSNVTAFVNAMARLGASREGIPRMGLVYGEPGLGKTRTALWWAGANDGAFVRTKKLMTGRWLLEEIVAELGEAPMSRTSDLFRQCTGQLTDRPRTLIIDEVDYLAYDARVLETLRDIHDTTNTPVVFIGMSGADKKLQRYRHLYDRLSEIVPFKPLTEADVASVASQLCEVALSKDAAAFIHAASNRFRQVAVWLYRAEGLARTNGKKEITAADLKGAVR